MSQEMELILNDLRARYKKSILSKKEYANEAGIALSTLDGYIAKGYGIPNYKKLGTAKNARVVFNLVDVARFFADTIKTA